MLPSGTRALAPCAVHNCSNLSGAAGCSLGPVLPIALGLGACRGINRAKCSVSREAGASTEVNVTSVVVPTRHGCLLHWQDADHNLPEYGLLGITVVDTDDWEKHRAHRYSCHHLGAGMYVNSS